MFNRFSRNKSFAIIFLSASLILSQPKTSLDLPTVIKKAATNSLIIKSHFFEKEASKNKYQNLKSKNLPDLALDLSSEARFLSPYNFSQNAAIFRSNWDLGDFIINSENIAKSEGEVIQSKISQAQLSVERRVASLYLKILLKQKELDIQSKREELMQRHKLIAELGWKAGTRSQLDVLQSEAEINKIKEEIELIANDKKSLFDELNYLIGIDSSDVELVPINSRKFISNILPDTSLLAITQTPFVKEYDYLIKSELLKKEAVAAQQYPTIGFGAGYFDDEDPTGDGSYWQLNAGVRIPLFMWGSTSHQKQIYDANVQSLKAQKNNVTRELKIFYAKTFNELNSYKEISKIQLNRKNIAEQAFNIAKVDYEAGIVTNLEFIDAQQSLAEIKIKFEETNLNFMVNLVDLFLAANQSERLFELLK